MKFKRIIFFLNLYFDVIVSSLLFLVFSFLFFYNLAGTSLVDFDEAWFAQIARNILENKQPFLLSFNESHFPDHPPFGFILISISFLIFGVTEFAARFPSALFGLGSIILVYFLGIKLFNRTIGFGAALMLASSVWFVLRARSADLDTIFLFFFLLSFYCVTLIKTNKLWIFAFSVAFSFTLLTKTLVGASILIPCLLYIVINRVKIPISLIIKAIILFFLLTAPWFLANMSEMGFSFLYSIYQVGARSENRFLPNILDLKSSLTIQYLHFGISEWFYPSVIAVIGSVAFIRSHKQLIPIYGLILFLMVGFLTNKKTEIWHLIPLYPFLAILVAFFLYEIVFIFGKSLSHFLNFKKITNRNVLSLLVIFPLFFLAIKQIVEFVDDINLSDKHVTGLAYTAKTAQGRGEKLYLDNDNFLPSAVFYSNKRVFHTKVESSPTNTLIGLVDFGEKPVLILTEKYRLQIDNIREDKYEVLSEHMGHVLIRVN